MSTAIYLYRQLARIVVESETPIAIGSGEKDITTDALVVTDINGFPYIPSSSLAGILRHEMKDAKECINLFGYQDKNDGQGSKVILSDAIIIGKEGKALDGIYPKEIGDPFYSNFVHMPVRQHVRMSEYGTSEAKEKGKFDGQIAFKGIRFVFEIEILSDKNDINALESILQILYKKGMRVGSGTRNGLGKLKIVEAKKRTLNLNKASDLNDYLTKSSCLSEEWDGYTDVFESDDIKESEWETYQISIRPSNFFLFGSGLSDDEADMTPVIEKYIKWNDGIPSFSEGTVIPATSIKGVLSHRTAYYWNKLNNRYVEDGNGLTGNQNIAVAALFGKSDFNESEQDFQAIRGNVLFEDIIIPKQETKIINHVSIDRFTGGALDGALFTEKANFSKKLTIQFEINVNKNAYNGDSTVKEAFEMAINDLRTGMLPLGGGTNRGNGIFLDS